ncbi:MAG TPA: DUF748 domain-containing protein, partial [Flavobacteriales bacterium]|nr:DUF748 domain-containing protein [Flavobacteriales bacterium]
MKRRWCVVLGLIIVLLLAIAYLFPYLLKRYIEEHSEEWINRRVTIGSIVLQPFTGVYAVKDFTCYEPKSDVVFVRFAKLGVKADVWDGYRKGHWHFREAELRTPYFRVSQNGDRFNFSDLLELGGTEKEEPAPADTTAIAFDVQGLAISGGRIDYSSDILHEPMSVTDLGITCSRISSAQAVMEFLLGFGIGGGEVKGGFVIDTQAGGYSVNAQLRKFGLVHVLPYVKDFMDCSTLGGELDVDLALRDSYVDSNALDIGAASTIRQFDLKDPGGEVLMGFRELHAELDTLTASNGHFEIGDVKLDGAALRFVLLNDWSDNWTSLMKLGGDSTAIGGDSSATSESNIFVMLADYVSYLGSQFVASDYSAKSVALSDCSLHFEDYTPRLPFKYDVSALSLSSNKVSSAMDAGHVRASAVLNGSGKLNGTAVFDPDNLKNVTVDLTVDGLHLQAFDPYSRWYAAHPMEDGVGGYATKTVLNNGTIDSQNSMRVDKLKFGKKVQEHDTGIYVLPLRLAAGLLKDAKGVVKLDVPVKGDLKDPQFRVWPIVWQIFKNQIVKAATAPANLLARAVGGADEKE